MTWFQLEVRNPASGVFRFKGYRRWRPVDFNAYCCRLEGPVKYTTRAAAKRAERRLAVRLGWGVDNVRVLRVSVEASSGKERRRRR